MKPLNQNKMEKIEQLREMTRYYNLTRHDQIVEIKQIQGGTLWYEVIQQNAINKKTEFCCSVGRFINLYKPIK